jgi:hypothetical protein
MLAAAGRRSAASSSLKRAQKGHPDQLSGYAADCLRVSPDFRTQRTFNRLVGIEIVPTLGASLIQNPSNKLSVETGTSP